MLKHGKGTQIWKNVTKYEGDWINGKAYGKGTFFHLNGDIYQVEFRDVYFHQNGSKYDGVWCNDLKDGLGREEWGNDSYYVGHFKQ